MKYHTPHDTLIVVVGFTFQTQLGDLLHPGSNLEVAGSLTFILLAHILEELVYAGIVKLLQTDENTYHVYVYCEAYGGGKVDPSEVLNRLESATTTMSPILTGPPAILTPPSVSYCRPLRCPTGASIIQSSCQSRWLLPDIDTIPFLSLPKDFVEVNTGLSLS